MIIYLHLSLTSLLNYELENRASVYLDYDK